MEQLELYNREHMEEHRDIMEIHTELLLPDMVLLNKHQEYIIPAILQDNFKLEPMEEQRTVEQDMKLMLMDMQGNNNKDTQILVEMHHKQDNSIITIIKTNEEIK